MDKIYFTITGTSHYLGRSIFKENMKVKLVKEPDNEYDKEAIKVEVEGLGQVGYVANSPYTVKGESISAGRLYDKIGEVAFGKVRFATEDVIICTLSQKSLLVDCRED